MPAAEPKPEAPIAPPQNDPATKDKTEAPDGAKTNADAAARRDADARWPRRVHARRPAARFDVGLGGPRARLGTGEDRTAGGAEAPPADTATPPENSGSGDHSANPQPTVETETAAAATAPAEQAVEEITTVARLTFGRRHQRTDTARKNRDGI